MKTISIVMLVILSMAVSACGRKAKRGENSISQQYALMEWYDVNNKSTLNLAALPADLPQSIDLKEGMTKVKDQDERGTCSFFASAAVVEAAIKKKMNVDVNISEEFFNYTVKSNGIDPKEEGSFPANNLRVVIDRKKGFLLEKNWPYQPSWFGKKAPCLEFGPDDSKAPAECFSHNAPPESVLTKIIPSDQFKNLELDSGETNDIILALAEGYPLVISVPVNKKGWQDNGETNYTEELRQECIKNASACGYHSIVLTGYDLKKQVFLFRNSWSKNWGKEGYGTIPFSVIDRHVSQHLSTVELKNNIELPENFDKDDIRVEQFEITAHEIKDGTIIIRPEGKIINPGQHALIMSSSLSKLDVSKGPVANDENVDIFVLSDQEAAQFKGQIVSSSKKLFAQSDKVELDLYDEFYGTLNWGSDLMGAPSVKKFLMEERSRSALARTSIYIYSDDSKYKVLARKYNTITY